MTHHTPPPSDPDAPPDAMLASAWQNLSDAMQDAPHRNVRLWLDLVEMLLDRDSANGSAAARIEAGQGARRRRADQAGLRSRLGARLSRPSPARKGGPAAGD